MKSIKYLLLAFSCFLLLHCNKSTSDVVPPIVDTGIYFPSDKVIIGQIKSVGPGIKQYGHVWDTLASPTLLRSAGRTQFFNATDTVPITSPVDTIVPNNTYYMRAYWIDPVDNVGYGQSEIQYNPADPSNNILIACFSMSKTECSVGDCTVSFDASCSVNAEEYRWDFDGDGVFDSSVGNVVSYDYTLPGVYNVKLQVVNADGFTQDTVQTIQVSDIVADFDIPGGTIYEDCELTFTNNSIGTTSYLWDFGDGNTSTEEEPTYTYANPGIYTVRLTATINGIEREHTQEIAIIQATKFERVRSLGTGDDVYSGVVAAADGGYVLTGSTSNQGAGNGDLYMAKTDTDGILQWETTFGGSNSDGGEAIVASPDGGYAIAGSTGSSGSFDFYLVKTDDNGNLQWERSYGGSGTDEARALVVSPDGGYVLAGYTDSQGAGSSDFYLIKTDANGNLIWEKTFGGSGTDLANALVLSPDGGYAIAGSTSNNSFYLVKTDANGNLMWEKTYGGGDGGYASGLIVSPDGGYALAGRKDAGAADTYLVKTDADGNLEWENTFGENVTDFATCIAPSSDNGYLLAGFIFGSPAVGDSYVYLVKTDAVGNLQWEDKNSFGGEGFSLAFAIQMTEDCGYIIAGENNTDLYLIKTDAEGNAM